jgi:hypothetical protein
MLPCSLRVLVERIERVRRVKEMLGARMPARLVRVFGLSLRSASRARAAQDLPGRFFASSPRKSAMASTACQMISKMMRQQGSTIAEVKSPMAS